MIMRISTHFVHLISIGLEQHKFEATAAAGEVYVKEEKVIPEVEPEPFLSA